jgi:16S rRNA (guanine966-N2)-methyltransferase
LRPATGYLREAVFSSLGPRVVGAKVLDLFAGTGAMGLEAISRGAAKAVWVDANDAAVDVIRINLAAVAKSMDGTDPKTLGLACEGDAFVWQPSTNETFDLAFIDPPYALLPDFGAQLLTRVTAWITPGTEARILLEAPGEYTPTPPPGWKLVRRLGKGKRQPNSLVFQREE